MRTFEYEMLDMLDINALRQIQRHCALAKDLIRKHGERADDQPTLYSKTVSAAFDDAANALAMLIEMHPRKE